MKKDWLKDIHDRMADFEVEVPVTRDQREQPQGLWDDICAATTKGAVIGSHKKQYRIWIGSSAAAAACLLLFWFLRPDLEQVTEVLPEESSQQSNVFAHTEEFAHEEQQIITAATSGKMSNKSEQNAILSNIFYSLKQSEEAKTSVEAKTSEEVKPSTETKTTTGTKTEEEAKPTEEAKPAESNKYRESKQGAPLTQHYEYLAQTTHKRRNSDPRLSVGFSTSDGFGSDNRQLFRGDYAQTSSSLTKSDWVDSPLLGIMALNRGVETERKVTHHAPIRTGLSFAYRLNDRWSIESGITYALVSSGIHEGSASNFIEEEQKLHYVGIPLGATYRLLSWKRLDLYLSSNILSEQCVSGQLRQKFIIGSKTQGEEENTTLQSRPMQWSVGAKAGVQYNLTPLLSIYAEPGCNYYFDDHSSLETVFKDKVFDFNLNLGLRFTVGRFTSGL